MINEYVSGNEALVGTGALQIEITKVVLTLAAGVYAVLAGVYAMARLADDWTEQRQVCIDVLCGYLRMNRPTADGTTADGPGQEHEVRATIQTLMAAHLRDPDDLRSWSKLNFNFERARLVNCVFSETTFTQATFTGFTSFNGATFSADFTGLFRATFARTSFAGAAFSGNFTTFDEVVFEEPARFGSASFAATRTSFDTATFDSSAKFDGATFSGQETSFDAVTFSGQETSFLETTVTGNELYVPPGIVLRSNDPVRRNDSPGEQTSFRFATFDGNEVVLGLSSFHGEVTFDGSTWRGTGTVALGPLSPNQPSKDVRVSWNQVDLIDGARVTLHGKPFHGWPPNQPAQVRSS